MPHYTDFICASNGTALYNSHSKKWEFCPTKVAAENKLLSNVNCWAGINNSKAEEEMALLTRLVRES